MSSKGPLSVQKDGPVTVVVFGQEHRQLDEASLERIGRQLLDVAETADPPLVAFDLTVTEFFGSSFIETLFRTWKKLNTRAGARIAICGLQPYCREVLEITHLDRLWPLPATRAEGVALLSSPPTE